jgi:Xaa-Pro aminopeptidase
MVREHLINAENISIQFFKAIESRNLIVPGKTEAEINEAINALAVREFSITNHWHKKIVRSGENTLAIYPDNPPDRMLRVDDIVFIDWGPIINDYEADIGRTYVLGYDPLKIKIRQDVEAVWYQLQQWYKQHTELKASVFFQMAEDKAREYGWEFGGAIAGHIVGKYPHEQPADPSSMELDIHPDNHQDMFQLDADGNKRHWILELQFVDRTNQIGAYFEQLL